jgi:hypothetical protein
MSNNSLTLYELQKQNNNHITNATYFKTRINYGSNDYLPVGDYSSAPIFGQYINNTNKILYITQFSFQYEHASSPMATGIYHDAAGGGSVILGRMKSLTWSAPYHTIKSNLDQCLGSNRRTFFFNNIIFWNENYSQCPISIPPTYSFGHQVACDMTSGNGHINPAVGIIEGYFY